MSSTTPSASVGPRSSTVAVAHVVYALHAVSVGIGVLTTTSVVFSFLVGPLPIIAVVLNYALRGDARGSWLDSHFSWQIRTFWWAVLWSLVIVAVSVPLALILVGFATWIVGFFILGVWVAARVVRGWLRLRDRRPMPF